MKCPECGYLCSDLRDVCGSCAIDLRPRKKELGIRIMHPETPYEELAAKVTKKIQVRTQSAPTGGILGGLKSFFAPPPAPAARERWIPVKSIETTEPKTTEAQPIEKRIEIAPPQATPPPAAPKSSEPKRASFLRPAAPKATTAPAFTRTINTAVDYEKLSTPELWDVTARAIQSHGGAAQAEFSTSQLRALDKEHEEIEILWALVDEAIQDPNAAERYREITRSETREVQAETAAQLLKKVEKTLTTQVFSLKRGGPRLSKHDDAELVNANVRIPTKTIDPATPSERCLAGLVDAGYMAFLAILITFGVTWFIEPDSRNGFLQPSTLGTPEYLSFGAVFLILFIAVTFLYPWFAGTRTIGQKLFGLEVIEATGREPSQAELFLRSAMLPLSLLVTLFIPKLWTELGFHNRLSNTVTSRLSPENQ